LSAAGKIRNVAGCIGNQAVHREPTRQ
jgi:hypothetical protein